MKTIILAILSVAAASAAMSVKLESTVLSPQPVGSVIGFIPRVQISGFATFNYRYTVSTAGGPFRMVRDFSQAPDFTWAPELYEHEARVRVTVRNNATKETADAEIPFRIVSRVKGTTPVITPTSHPLVALFSAPACPEGTEFRVAFRRQGEEVPMHTPAEPCRSNISKNVLVAGMRADSDYQMRAELVKGGSVKPGGWMMFHTGLLDGRFTPVTTVTPRAAGQTPAEPIVIRSMMEPWRSSATDLDGNVVWYLNPASNSFMTRLLPGGHFLVHADGANTANDMKRWQVLREVDLLGNTLRETNIGVMAEQLEARGIKSDCKKGGRQCVSGFHHESIRLANGHTLVLAGLERMFPAGTQGAKEEVDVLGDLLLDLDENLQLTWFWNSFDHLDIKRASLADGKCKGGPGDDGCTPVFLASEANGWLHSNALYYDARTGDVLVSVPDQDWIIKLDYKNGKGSGKILWRLGKDGDFTTNSTDPYPWFSYQHDAGFDPETGLLVLFDDGHRRKDKDPKANNRGQVWKIDEAAKTATPVVNADMGVYAIAVGSAQPLSGGGYSFEAGFINPGPTMLGSVFSRTIETSADGKIVYAQQADGALTYRSFRVRDMYSVPRK
jgi:arylsulfate sulfotransferase